MRKLNLFLFIFAIALCFSSAPVQAGTWTTLPIRSYCIDENNIVGSIGVPAIYNITTQTVTPLAYLPTADIVALHGIDGNNIVGNYGSFFHQQGLFYNETSWTTLNFPNGGNTFVAGIDGSNIVGSYGQNSMIGYASSNHGFIYNLDNQSWTTLDAPETYMTRLTGIGGTNIVGYTISCGLIYNMTTQSWTTFVVPAASTTYIYGISGDNIVGTYWLGATNPHGFLYNILTHNWTTLDMPGSIYTSIYGIDKDNLVGIYGDTYGQQHGFLYVILKPVAEAGPDQTIYADVNGLAKVALDGSDSNDPDGYVLTYKWTWTIDADTYETNSVSPAIELPVGVHKITLVVNDGFSNSAPDDVNITVIAPFECKMKITPQTINRKSNQPYIQAVIELPDNIAPNDVDANEPLMMYPGAIPARNSQGGMAGRGDRPVAQNSISASFDKDALMAAAPTGDVVLTVVGKLQSGQYFCASDTVKIIH